MVLFHPRIRLPVSISRTLRAIRVHSPPLNFITLHYAYFIGVCLFASIIFWVSSTPSQTFLYIDALFLVISAMTLAGLNTINLSTLNTIQQIILFLLILLGSAIWVSIAVVYIRRKAFELRFKSIVDEARQRRRERSTSGSRSSVPKSSSQSRGDNQGVIERGRTVVSDNHDHHTSNNHTANSIELENLTSANGQYFPGREEGVEQAQIIDDLETGHRDSEATQIPDDLNIDSGVTRRITFASPSSPTRMRQHGRILSMQGVGARQDIQNHPHETTPIYPHNLPKIDETDSEIGRNSILRLSSGKFIGRNSQFSGLTFAEREKLGGAEYRAVTMLSIIVPLYFVLWQLLGCIGLGAYVAYNRPDAPAANAENPWWVGAFNGVSAFNNSGMSLLDANMVAFQTSEYMLVTMGLMILAGNTCYPVFLRFIIWTMWKSIPNDASSRFHDHKVTLRFLLDHPRRCYTNLFPSKHTWWLLATLICLNGMDWIAFEVLNTGNPTVTSLPSGARALDGLFQALAVRSGGFYVVSIPGLRVGLLILYVIMMYISVYPVVITMRNSNVYEERSLGIYADDPQAKEAQEEQESPNDSIFDRIKRTLSSKPGSGTESNSQFVRQQLRGQLAHDLWWIVLAVLFITITETANFERDPISYSVFNVVFEVVSGYGCVGISVGLPNQAYSFCGGWHKFSKLILCAVMLRGRHRGLPVAIDRAVLLPGEHLAAAEEEDAQIRLDRTVSATRGVV